MKTVLEEVVAAMGGEEELSTRAPPTEQRVSKESGGSTKPGVESEVKQVMKEEGDFVAFSILDDILIKAIKKAKNPERERKCNTAVAVAAYHEQIKTDAENREEAIKKEKIEDNASRISYALSTATQPLKKSIVCTSIVDAYKQANLYAKRRGKTILSRTMTSQKAKKIPIKKSIGFTPVVAAYKQAREQLKMRENERNVKTRRVREGREKMAKMLSTPIVEAYQLASIDNKISAEFVETAHDSEAQEVDERMRDASTASDTEELEEEAELWNLALNCGEMAAVDGDDETASV